MRYQGSETIPVKHPSWHAPHAGWSSSGSVRFRTSHDTATRRCAHRWNAASNGPKHEAKIEPT
jgi:hypothetical protein